MLEVGEEEGVETVQDFVIHTHRGFSAAIYLSFWVVDDAVPQLLLDDRSPIP